MKIIDASCGEHFLVVLATNRESKIESEYSRRFKGSIISDAKKNIQII